MFSCLRSAFTSFDTFFPGCVSLAFLLDKSLKFIQPHQAVGFGRPFHDTGLFQEILIFPKVFLFFSSSAGVAASNVCPRF